MIAQGGSTSLKAMPSLSPKAQYQAAKPQLLSPTR